MTIVFQSISQNSGVTVSNGDDLAILKDVQIFTTGLAVTLSSGTTQTSVVNNGHLYGSLVFNVNSDHSRIVNYGTVSAIASGGTVGEAFNFGGAAGAHNITNFGTITAERDLFTTYEASDDSVYLNFTNHGRAVADRDILWDSSGSLVSTRINNSGYLQGYYLSMNGSGSSSLMNTGTLHAGSIYMYSDSAATLTNHGLIANEFSETSIHTSLVADVVINSGTIMGDINLYDGADQYAALNAGVVSGIVSGDNGNDTLTGGRSDDELRGGNDQDLLVGRDGDDTLLGGAGFDRLVGGDGNDSLDGGTNNDTLNGDAGNDMLLGGFGNDVLVGQDGDDLLDGGFGNDIIDGGNGNDILEGGAGNDILRGRGGEDDLAGGLGLDLLTGGQDADNFVFRSVAETVVGANRDQILDFEQGVDLIVVAGLSQGVFEFRDTAGFAPSGNPELRLFETPTGSTIVQLDANGDGTQDAEIRVANVTGLTAQDFVL